MEYGYYELAQNSIQRSRFKLIAALRHQRFSQGLMAAVAELKADHEKVRASITIGHSDHDGAE
jgi:hypothetical protein